MECLVAPAPGVGELDLDKIRFMPMNVFAEHVLASSEETRGLLLRLLAEGAVPISELVDTGSSENHQSALLRTLGWLGKMGLVRFFPRMP